MKTAKATLMTVFVFVIAAGWLRFAQAGDAGTKTEEFDTLLSQARSTLTAGQFDAAEKLYRKALCLKPGHAVARYELGSCYLDMGRSYEARSAFRLALSARAGDGAWEGQCRLAIARTWEESRHFKQALHEYRLALAADSSLAEARAASERLRAEVD